MASISLHIGLPHSGSTTIQNFLVRNRPSLLAHGILYPQAPGNRSHRMLAAYARDEKHVDHARRRFGLKDAEAIRAFRGDFAKKLADEIGAANPQRIIFSTEHLSWYVTAPHEIARLRELLAPHGDVDRIVVYLRRQSSVMLSRYSNGVKAGVRPPAMFPLSLDELRRYDYRRMLDTWSAAFGQDKMIVRVLDQSTLKNGDLQEDAADALALPSGAAPAKPPNVNESLDVASLSFLNRISRHFDWRNDREQHTAYYSLVATLRQLDQGPKVTAARWKLNAFMMLFASGNRAVARKYFNRDGLFPPEPSRAGKAMRRLSFDDAMDIAARAWIARERDITRLSKQNKNPRSDAATLETAEED